jgi:hypothetical protein
LSRKPAFEHPRAWSIEIWDCVGDASDPAVVFTPPFQEEPWPSTGVAWCVDDPAMAGVITASWRCGADPFGQGRAVASRHAAGHGTEHVTSPERVFEHSVDEGGVPGSLPVAACQRHPRSTGHAQAATVSGTSLE